MKLRHAIVPALAALAFTAGLPAAAQTSTETKVSHDSSVDNGVATHKTKVVRTTKRKTHRAKKILGVKVGHKTVTSKTVHETSASTNGDATSTTKTSN